MQILYEDQYGDEYKSLERVEFKPIIKISADALDITASIEKHTVWLNDGVRMTEKTIVYQRKENLTKVSYEEIAEKLNAKLDGFRGGNTKKTKHKVPKSTQNRKVELDRKYQVTRVKNGKVKVDLTLVSIHNNKEMKLFTSVSHSETLARSVVDGLGDEYEVRITKSVDLQNRAHEAVLEEFTVPQEVLSDEDNFEDDEDDYSIDDEDYYATVS